MDTATKHLRSQSKTLDPVLNLGKNGLTDAVIAEVKRMLRQKKLIKIRLNKGIFEPNQENAAEHPDAPAAKIRAKDLAKELAQKTDSLLVDCVGHIVVLSEKVPAGRMTQKKERQ